MPDFNFVEPAAQQQPAQPQFVQQEPFAQPQQQPQPVFTPPAQPQPIDANVIGQMNSIYQMVGRGSNPSDFFKSAGFSDQQIQEYLVRTGRAQAPAAFVQQQQQPPAGQQQPPAGQQQPPAGQQQPPAGQQQAEPSPFSSPFMRGTEQAQQLTPDLLPSEFKSRFNIDINSQNGADTLLKSVEKWRKDSTRLSEAQKQLNQFEDFFTNVPADLRAAIEDYSNGRDYRVNFFGDAIKIDYSKPFESMTPEQKVAFAKSLDSSVTLTPADIEKPENAFFQSSLKISFDAKKQAYESQKNLNDAQAADRIKAYQTAVDGTVSSLSTKFQETFNNDEVRAIKSLLKPSALMSALFDKNGNPKPDAAEKIAFMLYGNAMYEDIKRTSFVNGQNAAIMRDLQGGQQMPRVIPAAGNLNGDPAVEQAALFLKHYVKGKIY